MVLGMVTGSVPMLFSLLVMQGITLTMWRSFLDKAIPRYNGGNLLRQNIEQAVAGAANLQPQSNQNHAPAPQPLPPLPSAPLSSSEASQPNLASLLLNSDQASQHQQQQQSSYSNNNILPPNSIAHSLQILSKLDPSVIQLLNTLSGGKQSEPPSTTPAPTTTTTAKPAAPAAPLFNSPMMGDPSAAQWQQQMMMYGGGQGDFSTDMSPVYGGDGTMVQYGPNGEPIQTEVDQNSYNLPVDPNTGQLDYGQLMQYQQQQQQYIQSPYAGQEDAQALQGLPGQEVVQEQEQQVVEQPSQAGLEQLTYQQYQQQQQQPQLPLDPNVQYQYVTEGLAADEATTETGAAVSEEEVPQEEGGELNQQQPQQYQQEVAASASSAEEYERSPEQDLSTGEETDKEAAEDRPPMPPVIIGPPIGASGRPLGTRSRSPRRRRKKSRKKAPSYQLEEDESEHINQMYSSKFPTTRNHRKSRWRKKPRGMFGRPRIAFSKRMLESSSSQTTTKSLAVKKGSKTVQIAKIKRKRSHPNNQQPPVISRRILNNNYHNNEKRSKRVFRTSTLTTSTKRPPTMFRFVTPNYPLPLLEMTSTTQNPLDEQPTFLTTTRTLHAAGVLPTFVDPPSANVPSPTITSVSLGGGGGSGARKTVRLRSQKIRLIDLEGEGTQYRSNPFLSTTSSNCTSGISRSKGTLTRFSLIWSAKEGWKNTTADCNSTVSNSEDTVQIRLSPVLHSKKKRKNLGGTTSKSIGEVLITSTTTSTSTESSETTTVELLPTPISTQSTSPSVTTLVPPVFEPEETSTLPSIITSTTTSSTTTATQPSINLSLNIPDSFITNFNLFLASLTTPMPSVKTTTTSIPPTTTEAKEEEKPPPPKLPIGADQLPKEFLSHVLHAINASKIDDFQVHKQRDNSQIPSIISRNRPKDLETEDDGESGEEEEDDVVNSVDLGDSSEDDENRVDGKNRVGHRFKRICYYLLEGGKDGQVAVEKLELHICSHLIVGYARINAASCFVVAERPLEDSERYRRLTLAKLQHPQLKVLLSVGDLGGAAFSVVASSNRTRRRFVDSLLDFADEFRFDGVDLDWEFPALRSGFREDRRNFVLLLEELRNRADEVWRTKRSKKGVKISKKKKKANFIISVAVGAPLIIASTSYIIPALAKVVDFVNLQSYDFHSYRADRPYTGHHSPLYPRSTDQAYYSTLNVAWAATYWANSGMPLKKIMVGVPTYARTYNLVVPIGQGMINAPASGPGLGRGKINYSAVCAFLRMPDTSKHFDVYSQVPYAYRNYDWIAYENEMSVAIKAQWVIKTGMGGVVTFALNFDDAQGTCREDGKRFPLQKTISNLLELASIKSYKRSSFVMKVRY